MVANNCRREEKQPGNVINLDTGKTFSWNDSCVKHGATVGYDPRALEEAIKAVKDFLRTQWKLNPQGYPERVPQPIHYPEPLPAQPVDSTLEARG